MNFLDFLVHERNPGNTYQCLKIQNGGNVAIFKETTKTWKIIFPFLSSNVFKRQIAHMYLFCFPDSRIYAALKIEKYACDLVTISVPSLYNIEKKLHDYWEQISVGGLFKKNSGCSWKGRRYAFCFYKV